MCIQSVSARSTLRVWKFTFIAYRKALVVSHGEASVNLSVFHAVISPLPLELSNLSQATNASLLQQKSSRLIFQKAVANSVSDTFFSSNR